MLTNSKTMPEEPEKPKGKITVKEAVTQYLSCSGWLPKVPV